MPPLETYKSKIQSFYRRHRRMPSYAEIMTLTGFKSKNAVAKLIDKLIALGEFAKDATGRLIPKKLGMQIPALGIIEAGWPSPAEEELLDTITLDDYLIRNKEATKILTVQGDSMIEAGIMPGDQALIEFGAQPKNGSIVIARVDGGWTLKYFQKRGNEITLIPANKKYQPIIPKEELSITAVVRAVIRKY